MPPIDIYRAYYMVPRPGTSGAEHAATVSAIIEQVVAHSYYPNTIDRTTTDVAVFNENYITCTQRHSYTRYTHHANNRDCGRYDKHKPKTHHHHHKHHDGVKQVMYHNVVHNGQHQPYREVPLQESLSAVNFAFTELTCLGLSLLLSICLLLVGYKIGNIVCKYEVVRNRDHGRGHKGSFARCQDKPTRHPMSRDASVQCNDSETDPLLSL
ncbi:hypothetical protein IWW43_003255 [Coemansia sp. RSA 1935]|nr:hypothetical protein IWW43_003255 [Coemansia sp. RSA 1935]